MKHPKTILALLLFAFLLLPAQAQYTAKLLFTTTNTPTITTNIVKSLATNVVASNVAPMANTVTPLSLNTNFTAKEGFWVMAGGSGGAETAFIQTDDGVLTITPDAAIVFNGEFIWINGTSITNLPPTAFKATNAPSSGKQYFALGTTNGYWGTPTVNYNLAGFTNLTAHTAIVAGTISNAQIANATIDTNKLTASAYQALIGGGSSATNVINNSGGIGTNTSIKNLYVQAPSGGSETAFVQTEGGVLGVTADSGIVVNSSTNWFSGDLAIGGTFTGNGAGLTNVPLAAQAGTLTPLRYSTNITFKNFWIMDDAGVGTETSFIQDTNGTLNITADSGINIQSSTNRFSGDVSIGGKLYGTGIISNSAIADLTIETNKLSATAYAAFIGGSSSGSAFSNLVGVVSVKEYGAVGDGSTDDTAAFQLALTNANVYVPPGTYKLTSALNATNVFITGAGGYSVLSNNVITNGSVLSLYGVSTLSKVKLIGKTAAFGAGAAGSETIGVTHQAYGDGAISDVSFVGFSNAISVVGINDTSARTNNAVYSFLNISNCYVGLNLADNNAAEYVRIQNSAIRNSTLGIANYSAANILMTGNKITDCNSYGYYAKPATVRGHSLFSGNMVNHTAGVYLWGVANLKISENEILGGGTISFIVSSNCIFSDNIMQPGNPIFSFTSGISNVIMNNHFLSGSTTTYTGASATSNLFVNNLQDGYGLVLGTGFNANGDLVTSQLLATDATFRKLSGANWVNFESSAGETQGFIVKEAGTPKMYFQREAGDKFAMYVGDGVTKDMVILDTGNVGIGRDTPGSKLDVAGSIASSTTVTATNGYKSGTATNVFYSPSNAPTAGQVLTAVGTAGHTAWSNAASGGSQTPWTSDIQASSNSLFEVKYIYGSSNYTGLLLGASPLLGDVSITLGRTNASSLGARYYSPTYGHTFDGLATFNQGIAPASISTPTATITAATITNATITTANIQTNNTAYGVVTNMTHASFANVMVFIDSAGAFTNVGTSAFMRAAISDESGTGAALFAGGDIAAGTATTASANDNDTSIATTAFVQSEIGNTTTITLDGIAARTNLFTINGPLYLGTNFTYTSGAATGGLTGVGGTVGSTELFSQLTIKTSGDLVFTNPAAFYTSDGVDTRTFTNGNLTTVLVHVIPGFSTNLTYSWSR